MSKDYIVEITDGDYKVEVTESGDYIVNVGEYISGIGYSNLGDGGEVLNDASAAADIQFRTLVSRDDPNQRNITISQTPDTVVIGTVADLQASTVSATTFNGDLVGSSVDTGTLTATNQVNLNGESYISQAIISQGTFTGPSNHVVQGGDFIVDNNVSVGQTLSTQFLTVTNDATMADINSSGTVTAPDLNFSGTITGSDYDDVATIDGPANITITTGDTNFLFADTQDFYVGSLEQAAHITSTEIKAVGDRLTLHGELNGAVVYQAKNREGSTISKGTPVYISGHNGNTVEIGIADANDPAKMPAFGIADEEITDNNNGEIVTFGELRGFDTSSFLVGDELFVSETGTLTVTRPVATDAQVQKMAKVVRSHSQNGILFVMGAGRTNDIPNEFSRSIIPDTTTSYDLGSSTKRFRDAYLQQAYIDIVNPTVGQTAITLNGHVLPQSNLTYDLGSPSAQFRSAYVGPGSLYIDGHKVLGSDETGDIDLTTDPNQNLNIQAGGTITMLSTGEATTLSDDTINLSSASGTTNVLGTLDVADHMEVGDTNYDNGLIDASGANQNLEIRTNGTGYLHANIGGSAYFGSFSSAVQLDGANKSIGVIGGDLTLANNTSVNGTLDVSGATTLDGTLTVNGSASTKNTIIGDSSIGPYDLHGFTVNGGDTAWAGVSLVETTGSTNKPINNFSNPAFSTTIFGGTEAAKTGVESGKRIWSAVALASQDGTTPQFANFRILSETTEQQSASARGAKMTIETTGNGSTSTTKTLSLQDNEVTINPDGNGKITTGGNLTLDDDVQVTGTFGVDGSTTLNGSVTLGDDGQTDLTTFNSIAVFNSLASFANLDTSTIQGYEYAHSQGWLTIGTGSVVYCTDGDAGSPCLAVFTGTNFKISSLGGNLSTT